MRIIETLTGPRIDNLDPCLEVKNTELARRVQILSDVVQSLLDHIAEKEKVEIGITKLPRGFKLYFQNLNENQI